LMDASNQTNREDEDMSTDAEIEADEMNALMADLHSTMILLDGVVCSEHLDCIEKVLDHWEERTKSYIMQTDAD